MTRQTEQLSKQDGSLLLRELNHRINNDLTCIVLMILSKARQSDSLTVQAALLDVIDVLLRWAEVHNALRMPDQGRLTDAAKYLRELSLSIAKYRLACLGIRVVFSAEDLRLEGERCWRLGLIVSELLTNVARHAHFDVIDPELRVELRLAGGVVKCKVSDNGLAPEPIRRGRGLTIVAELVSSLSGRLHASSGAEVCSVLLTFPLTEAEQRASDGRGASPPAKPRCMLRARGCA